MINVKRINSPFKGFSDDRVSKLFSFQSKMFWRNRQQANKQTNKQIGHQTVFTLSINFFYKKSDCRSQVNNLILILSLRKRFTRRRFSASLSKIPTTAGRFSTISAKIGRRPNSVKLVSRARNGFKEFFFN